MRKRKTLYLHMLNTFMIQNMLHQPSSITSPLSITRETKGVFQTNKEVNNGDDISYIWYVYTYCTISTYLRFYYS